jgi:hypothetical protein
MAGSGGKAPKVSAAHTVAVYDPIDGRLIHLHHVVVFDGGKSISPQEAEVEAIEHARRQGHKVAKLKTLLVREPLLGGGHFRVDVARGKLIALEPPARRRLK